MARKKAQEQKMSEKELKQAEKMSSRSVSNGTSSHSAPPQAAAVSPGPPPCITAAVKPPANTSISTSSQPTEKSQIEASSSAPTATPAPSTNRTLDKTSVLADAYVPRRSRIINETPVSVVLSAIPPPSAMDSMFWTIRRDLAPMVPACYCANRVSYVPNTDPHFRYPARQQPPELYYAVEHQKKQMYSSQSSSSSSNNNNSQARTSDSTSHTLTNPAAAANKKRTRLPLVDNISDLFGYVFTFSQLLQVERVQVLLLYERYSHYNVEIETKINDGGTGYYYNTMSCKIAGISDCSPPLQPGDFVLLRPLRPCMLPAREKIPWQKHQVRINPKTTPQHAEVQASVTQVLRHDGGIVQATWLDALQHHVLSNAYSSREFHIRFVPNTKTYERCLTALDWLTTTVPPHLAMDLLFPSQAPVLPPDNHRVLVHDKELLAEQQELNDKQAAFVRMVLRRTLYPQVGTKIRGPMVLTGPAGTGKTRALLCAIRQVVALNDDCSNRAETTNMKPRNENMNGNGNKKKRHKKYRVLVCTPSHTAADVITRRLAKHLDPAQLFRLYDSDRPMATVPIEILGYCRQAPESDIFVLPPALELLSFEVIVATCSDAHLLYRAGLTNQQLRERRDCFRLYLEKACSGCGMEVELKGADDPHFTHFFLDEAAQATEPESLIPLSVVVDPDPGSNTRQVEIALCGDPRQLSPAVYSREAAEAGLDRSWMERILQRPVSCLGGGHDHMLGPQPVHMEEWLRYSFQQSDGQEQLSIFLTLNYRGHPSFLALPSALFYFDKLQSADFDKPSDTKSATYWCEKLRWLESLSEPFHWLKQGNDPNSSLMPDVVLQRKQFAWPIHFRGVVGKDVSTTVESFATNSWSNKEEAEAVVEIVETLANKQGVLSQSIGVMAPFRGQVVLIRKLLRAKNLGGVDVGTVENYQAVERDVIVLSLTRSSPSFVVHDKEKRMGLFGQRKRSNVALTRAENLFIVVGNPTVMAEDTVWREFLWFCLRNGLWYGAKISDSSIFEWTPSRKVVRCHRLSERGGFSVGQAKPQQDVDPSIVTVGTLERLLRSTNAV